MMIARTVFYYMDDAMEGNNNAGSISATPNEPEDTLEERLEEIHSRRTACVGKVQSKCLGVSIIIGMLLVISVFAGAMMILQYHFLVRAEAEADAERQMWETNEMNDAELESV
jgi:hypothetical protein